MSGVLVIDDEAETLGGIRTWLEFEGHAPIACCRSAEEAAELLTDPAYPLLLCDVHLPGRSGLTILDGPQVEGRRTIMISGQDEVDLAVRCIHAGAVDYLVKPIDPTRLQSAIARAGHPSSQADATALAAHGIISDDPAMRALYDYTTAIAGSREPVLISGESGTGKEHFARLVHNLSGRNGAFVPLNVASLDEHLFADALFGHQRGAYTGAEGLRQGLLEAAAGGTLFLDEIGDLPAAAQATLLRLIQEGEYYRLGDDGLRHADCRIVCASNRSLAELDGHFRSDLYYRLRVHHLDLPPLRARPHDIELLLEHFLSEAAAEYACQPPALPPRLRRALREHPFPGNVRELRALVLDAALRHARGLDWTAAFASLTRASGTTQPRGPHDLATIAATTEALIDRTLAHYDGNISAAARSLGITRQGLYKRLAARHPKASPAT